MNVNDISRLYTGAGQSVRPLQSARQTVAPAAETTFTPGDELMLDDILLIGDELPEPSAFTAYAATPDALRQIVESLLTRQYAEGGAYYRLLFGHLVGAEEQSETELQAPSVSDTLMSETLRMREERARQELPSTAVELVSAGGALSPQTQADQIAAYKEAMVELNPESVSQYSAAISLAFSNFSQLFGGVLPAITQQTLAAFSRKEDPFRVGVSETVADDPVAGIAESRRARL